MENLIKNLEKFLQSLNVEQLYKNPGYKNSKNWLAGVTATLKVGGRHSYKDFKNLGQHIYPSIPLETRKHAAEQIDVFLRQIIAQYKAEESANFPHFKNNKGINDQNPDSETYVNSNILEGFRLKKDHFNYQKLITLIEELNFNHINKKTYSSSMILRAIFDHIPPLLAKKDFNDVINHYNWGDEKSSRRKAVKELLAFRNTSDDVLHGQITNRNDIIDFSYLPHKLSVNALLQECLVSNTVSFIDIKPAKTNETKNENTKIELIIDLAEPKVSWANYAVGRWEWPSFRMVLSINNFRNKSAEYLSASLHAKSNDGIWEAKNYIFLNREDERKSRPNEEFRVEAGYKEKVSLFVSVYEPENREHKLMPDIDKNTIELIIETESGKKLILPIKAGWVGNG